METVGLPLGQGELVLRLVAALFLGGLIGLEREGHGRPAGFRTHILVCVGSALVMLVSAYGFRGLGPGVGATWDPARLAAQVVSGIGFLGAGTILREGPTVKGLTTAASLWVVAGIGLAVGIGFYLGAVVTTIVTATALIALDKVETRLLGTRRNSLSLLMVDEPGQLARVAGSLGAHRVNIRSIRIEEAGDGQVEVVLQVEFPPGLAHPELLRELRAIPGVRQATLER